MSRSIRLGCLSLVVLATASAVYAQGTLTGVVRDATGGVVPGVVVEASSPALTLGPPAVCSCLVVSAPARR